MSETNPDLEDSGFLTYLSFEIKRVSSHKEFLFTKDKRNRVPQSRIIVIKLNTGSMEVSSFYRIPLESEEGRLPSGV